MQLLLTTSYMILILSVYQEPVWADNPNNIKWGGVCNYYWENLLLKVINVNILQKLLVCELSFGSRCVCLVSIYRILSQSSNKYDTFLLHFDQLLSYLNSIDTAWKVPKYGLFSGPYFPAFGLNMEIYSVNLPIQSIYGRIRTRKNSVFGQLSRSENLMFY